MTLFDCTVWLPNPKNLYIGSRFHYNMFPNFFAGKAGKAPAHTHSLGTCVPVHVKLKGIQKKIRENRVPVFEVQNSIIERGYYRVKGRLLSGEIKPGLCMDFGDAHVKVSGVKTAYLSAEKLRRGEEGVLYLEGDNFDAIATERLLTFG